MTLAQMPLATGVAVNYADIHLIPAMYLGVMAMAVFATFMMARSK